MADQADINKVKIGEWNKLFVDNPRWLATLNRKPIDVTKDQLRKLYMLLYPFIASEFVHRSDLEAWAQAMTDQFNAKLEEIVNKINNHAHNTNVGPTTTLAVPNIYASDPILFVPLEIDTESEILPEDSSFKTGESFVLKAEKNMPRINERYPDASSPLIKNSDSDLVTATQISSGKILAPFDADEGVKIFNPSYFDDKD